ncbi:MAG: hypothetical protein ACJ75R_10600 [Solirubrobacterales bacterium]
MAAARAPGVTKRELLLLVVGACLVAVVMNWPLVLHLGETIPKDLGDPLPQSWQVAWGGHALAHQPLHFFQANQFWPISDSLAFSDALIGYAPAGLFGDGPHAAVFRYDLLFLFAYALAFAGAYLLARELGAGPLGALVAGAAFAFAPFRLEQDGHLHVISSGGIPLALALGVRGLRLGRPWPLFAGWLVAAWQLSLGFTLGLPLAYLLAALVLIGVVIWWRGGRPALERRLVVAAVAGAAVFLAVAIVISRPYQRVADAHPEVKRSPQTVAAYSGPLYEFLVAPDENLVWGDATAGLRDQLTNIPEKTLFPGLLSLALAIGGVGWAGYARGLRWGLAAGALAFAVLAIGFREEGGLLWPYRVVYDVLPGWQAIRTPGRLMTFASLALALLAAGGAERLATALKRRGRHNLAASTGAALALLVAIEGRGLPFDPTDSQAQPHVPRTPPSVASVPAPQLHLPALRAGDNRRYLLWSTDGFPEIVNGRSSTEPTQVSGLIADMDDFPSPDTVAELRRVGVKSVIVHLDRAAHTPQAGIAGRPVRGLTITRRRDGPLLVYDVRSPSASSPIAARGGDGRRGE